MSVQYSAQYFPPSIENEHSDDETESTRKRNRAQKAQTFLEERGRDLHPALDATNSSLHEQGPAPYVFRDSTYARTEEFMRSVEAYQDASRDPRVRAFNIRETNSWEEAMQAAQDVEAKYLLAGQNGTRKIGRKVADKAAIFLPYAASKISERREDVLKSLVRIPEVITQAEESCNNFGPDKTLFAKAENVYVAALAAMEDNVKWLSKRTYGKPWIAVRDGPTYNKSFNDKIDELDEALNSLEHHVGNLRDSRICRTEAGVRNLEAQMDDLQHLQQASKTAIEKMKEVLADTNRTAKWMRKKDNDIRRLKLRIRELEDAAASLTQDELIEIVDVNYTHPLLDLEHIVRHTDQDSPESQVALSIIAGSQFIEWQSDETSTALFIESGMLVSSRRISSLSLVSSTLIESYKDSPHAAAIYFFCGHHTLASDPLCGPQGMIRSLITQVLRLFSVNLDFISTRLRPLIEKLNFRDLCDCFTKLIKQLPASAVLFCIIDGISFFEKKEWMHQIEDCSKTIGDLRDLVYDSDTKAVFKLLVTSPARSRYIANIFEPEDRLSLLRDASRRQASERATLVATKRAPPPRQRQRGNLHESLRAQNSYRATEDDDILLTESDEIDAL